jgi:hypothetical protein
MAINFHMMGTSLVGKMQDLRQVADLQNKEKEPDIVDLKAQLT